MLVALLVGAETSFVLGVHAQELPPAPATAVESSDTVEARDAFRLGSTLAKQGQWLDALAAFQRSARLKPHPITTYNVAYCERALGHFARAYEQFSAALEPAPTPDAPALPPDLTVESQTYLAEAERRVARVKVALAAPELTMKVDGLSVSPMGRTNAAIFVVADDGASAASLPKTFELWLDPGTHVFIVTFADGGRAVESRTLEAGSSVAMEFARVPPAPAPAPSAAPPSSPSEAVGPSRHVGPNRAPAFIAFGVGAAGLVAGGIFGALALSEKGDIRSDPLCSGKDCPAEPAYRDKEARMVRFADFATAGLAVGVVGAAVGTYFWVTAKETTDNGAKGKQSRVVEPWIGVGAAGVRGKF